MVTKGVSVFNKIKDKVKRLIKPIEGAKDVVGSSIDFLQRKTGQIGTLELLEHSQRVTFWDFDGTLTGTIDMSITWFDFDRKENILYFYTAKRSFNKLQSSEVRASTLYDVGDFKPGESLRRRGKIKDTLPEPWERKKKYIKLAQSDFRSNFHGEKLSKLTLTKGIDTPPSSVPPIWPNGTVYNPNTTDCYKTTFDWTSSDVSGDDPVGYLDNNELLFIRGDDSEYPDDCKLYNTRGTFAKDYFCQSDEGTDEEKNRATSWSYNVVFLEYAYIQKGDTDKYPVETVDLGSKIYNPKIPAGGTVDDKSKYYDPFMKCIRDGLKKDDNWKKNFWAYWWDPSTKKVHGAVYMDREANEADGVSPWVIKRKYPEKDKVPDCTKWPVVAFVCKEHLPINFQSYDKDESKDDS